ncbi:hypothetical protein GCM10027610_105680 [Dactylosporangium cerinum]
MTVETRRGTLTDEAGPVDHSRSADAGTAPGGAAARGAAGCDSVCGSLAAQASDLVHGGVIDECFTIGVDLKPRTARLHGGLSDRAAAACTAARRFARRPRLAPVRRRQA